jgi:hypothetical protein
MLKRSDAEKNADCMILETSGEGVDGLKVKNLRACRQRDWSHDVKLESRPDSAGEDVSRAAV